MIKPVIVITHAAFAPERRESLTRLRSQLEVEGDGIQVLVCEDLLREGSLTCWRHAMNAGLSTDATHIVWLPDDAILCRGFGKAIRRAIEAQPGVIFDCVVNSSRVYDEKWNPDKPNEPPKLRLEKGWYLTTEGYVGGAGCMPRELLEEHLAWRDKIAGWAKAGEPEYIGNDTGVNWWAMATGRMIWKTARSLIDHDTSIKSLDGNDHHDFRRPLNFIEDASELDGWDEPPIWRGCTYRGQRWEPLWHPKMVPTWNPEWSYRAHRAGRPVSDKPHVFIAMPAGRCPELAVRKSIEAQCIDAAAHGIEITVFESPGDSLITRGRHVLMHEFLCSPATHLLQWDDDVECLDASAVRRMVESGYDVVGGAYPWRDGSGRVVANPPAEELNARGEGSVFIDQAKKCIRVADLGTGFLMTSRKCLLDLMKRHPELLYEADIEPYTGAPMWALFDVALEQRGNGRKRYASEDWHFCTLAREAGYGVFVYYPPIFRHWGKMPFQGHIVNAWGMNQGPREAAQ